MNFYKFILICCVIFTQEAWCKAVEENLEEEVIMDGRIVGGTQVQAIRNFPYMASLNLDNSAVCAGTIIGNRTILTAAHCLEGFSRAQIRIGSLNRNSGGFVYNSANFRIHPNYSNPEHLDYDIGCILLNVTMRLNNSTTAIINLAPPNTPVPNNTTVVVSGWGATREDGPAQDMLRTVKIPTVTDNRCFDQLAVFQNEPDVPVLSRERQFCAGFDRGGKDSCSGDSGGPAVLEMQRNRTQLGIVSFGVGCGEAGFPGVFINVSDFRGWIRDNCNV